MNNIAILDETLSIARQGSYALGENTVKLQLDREAMQEALVFLPEELPDAGKPELPDKSTPCRYSCTRQDSFSAALELTQQQPAGAEKPVLVLNFANPVHPGGGVRHGARAQEEDLCRCSTLLLSLESPAAASYYAFNSSLNSRLGSDAMILSPRVEVLRDAQGKLLPETTVVSVLTCAAPMITYGQEGLNGEQYEQLLFCRILNMLALAVKYGYRELVLGAWGCGVFGNDAGQVSDLFALALKSLSSTGKMEDAPFRHVRFAVLSRDPREYNYRQFVRNFGL